MATHSSLGRKTPQAPFQVAPSLGLLVVCLMCLALTLLSLPSRGPRQAAIFPPWWSAPQAMEAAAQAGVIAGLGRWDHIVVVEGDAPDTAQRLRAAGALVVVEATAFFGCAQKRPSTTQAQNLQTNI